MGSDRRSKSATSASHQGSLHREYDLAQSPRRVLLSQPNRHQGLLAVQEGNTHGVVIPAVHAAHGGALIAAGDPDQETRGPASAGESPGR